MMTIKVYPVKIEAVNENDDLAFTLEAFDQFTATLTVRMLLNNQNVDEFIDAVRKSMTLLELELEKKE